MARLRITTPDGHSRDHNLGAGRTVIGRGADCGIVIDHPTLSRQHAAIELLDGSWVVMDLGSKNGVRVEGRVVMRAALRPGDRFRCGKAEFEFSGEAGLPDEMPTRIGPAAFGPPPSPAPGSPGGPRAEHGGDDEITTEIPEIAASRKTIVIVVAGLGGFAAAAVFLAVMLFQGGKSPAAPRPAPVVAAQAPVHEVVPAPEKAAEPPLAPEMPVVKTAPDPEAPLPGEIRVRFRDGTARVGKIVKRGKFELEIECMVGGKAVVEKYGIEEILRIGDESVRPDWAAIFERKLAEAKDSEALEALDAWCRKYGYDRGRTAVREESGKAKADVAVAAVPAKATTARYGGRDRDIQELRAEGRIDARGRLVLSPADLRYTREVHFDLLGRSPTEDELQKAASEARGETVDRLLSSVECFETWYEEEVYYFLLLDNFRPATERLTSIPKKLSAGSMTIPDAIHEIVISQYFNHRNPGNDTYVTVIFEQLLGIVVQEQPMVLKVGKQMYDGYEGKVFGETGKSQSDLVSIVLKQKAFYELVLKRLHQRIAGVPIAAPVLANNVERVMADAKSFHDVMKEWLLDDAYLAKSLKLRKKSDHQFIRALYTDLLGRRATYDEFRLFRNAMQALADPTPIRSVLAKVMVDSEQVKVGKIADAKQWVRDIYVRMLGRLPNDSELAVFAEAVSSGKPKLAIQAIVDSVEYQNY